MLSLHEIAALIVLGGSDQGRELDPADVSALVLRELVRLEVSAPGGERAQVTSKGLRILNAVTRRNPLQAARL
jgi:hypothetical protein